MATRTNQLMGKVWGDPSNPATVVVNYNGQEVFNGTVTTSAGSVDPLLPDEDYEIVCSWTGDSAVNGSIPTSITITNGDVVIKSITMNQCRPVEHAVEKVDAVWPAHRPATFSEAQSDRKHLSAEDFFAKYGADSTIAYTNYDITEVTSMADNFMVPTNVAGFDPKQNVALNGTAWSDNNPGALGVRSYVIPAGAALTFDYSVIVQG
jgi:hypothetical protein